MNGDGAVNVANVASLIDHVLGKGDGPFYPSYADMNRDGAIDVADVSSLIDRVLGKTTEEPPVDLTFTVGDVTFTMVSVEGGTFTMGTNDTLANAKCKPAHTVTITGHYHIGQTEVTNGLWIAVMGSRPGYGYSTDDSDLLPINNVSWNDCQEFIAKLNEMTGKAFRLPTEAEWEFAARGGTSGRGYVYAGSDSINDVAWHGGNSAYAGASVFPHHVATKAPNELGIYDMSGNMAEWCQDWFGSYTDQPQTDPKGPETGTAKVYRSGSFMSQGAYCKTCHRQSAPPEWHFIDHGLRLAM